MASTLLASAVQPQGRELNILVNPLTPYIGFPAALLVTVPLTLAVVYVVHHRWLAFSELVAILVQLAVVNNLVMVVGRHAWQISITITLGLLGTYLVYGTVQHHRRCSSWREHLFAMPDPVLWQPASVEETHTTVA